MLNCIKTSYVTIWVGSHLSPWEPFLLAGLVTIFIRSTSGIFFSSFALASFFLVFHSKINQRCASVKLLSRSASLQSAPSSQLSLSLLFLSSSIFHQLPHQLPGAHHSTEAGEQMFAIARLTDTAPRCSQLPAPRLTDTAPHPGAPSSCSLF